MIKSLSVVIPCKNEGRFISICLDALIIQKNDGYRIEIIVVDNGSTDNTLQILEKYSSNITVYSKPDLSIPEVRNFGALNTANDWLAFVDADVEVDDHWCRQIENSLDQLHKRDIDIKKVVIGSTCIIPKNPTWVEKIWFQQLLERDKKSNKYINGANLIVHRELYDTVGGFDPKYNTGEDEKFCQDARARGAIILKDFSIKAIHHGYPKTVSQFFQRERWHGLGMTRYFSAPWKSKDLCLALYFLVTLLFFAIPFSLYKGIVLGILLTLMIMMSPLFLFSFIRSMKKIDRAIPLTWLYFIYGWARLFSLIDIILPFSNKGWKIKKLLNK